MERGWIFMAAAFSLAWFAVVVVSALATPFPFVLSDETNYLLPTIFGYTSSNYARWAIVFQIPDLLFYRVYALLPKTDLYAAAKVLNAAFVCAAAIPAYALARRYLDVRESALFVGLVVCAPISTLARFFMPETLYYFGFWVTVYALVATSRSSGWKAGLTAGAALGLLALVKPHALGLVLGIALYFALRPATVRSKAIAVLALAAAWYAVRTGMAYFLTGVVDWSVTGPAYRGVLSPNGFEPELILVKLLGHVASLVLLAGVPLWILGVSVVRDIRDRARASGPECDLALLALCLLLALVTMTVYFSYTVHFFDPAERISSRLHGRYYGFTLPLAILAYVAMLRRHGRDQTRTFSRHVLWVAIAATLLAWYIVAGFYQTTVVDYPELGILPRWPNGLVVPITAGAACVAGALWMHRRSSGWGDWPLVLPVIWWGAIGVSTSLLLLLAPAYGKFYLPDDVDLAMLNDPIARTLKHRGDGMIIGTDQSRVDTYRVMFHLASMSRGLLVDDGTVVTVQQIAGDARWLILLPGVRYTGPGEQNAMGPLTYVRLHQ